jgi:ribosomal protein S17E
MISLRNTKLKMTGQELIQKIKQLIQAGYQDNEILGAIIK